MHLKAMVNRLIELRQYEDRQVTLLAVCPNSDAVLEAAVLAASRNNCPMLFAATLNQVDRDGGYTGWTPAAFVAQMNEYAAKYHVSPDTLYPCLDHGGPWLKDHHTRDKLSLEETTAEVKASITDMLAAGYRLLHIDPTVDRTLDGPPSISAVVSRTIALILHAESERRRLGLSGIAYEVGTEEVHGGLVDLSAFEEFLRELQTGLIAVGLGHIWPAFVVAQVGTDLHTTRFDAEAAERLYQIVSPYGALVKGHYTDWVENRADYPLRGMGGANVGPEFTADEFDALMALLARETSLCSADSSVTPSGLLHALTQAVDQSNRWQKWLQSDENGLTLDQLAPERRLWIVKTSARYIWTQPQVAAARVRLYDNLHPMMDDPAGWVVEYVARAIERYIIDFGLFASLRDLA